MGPLSSLPSYAQPWVAWEQAKIEAHYDAMNRGVYAPTYRQFWTGNASLAREHLLATGGFNPEFLRGEDVELGVRLHERGLGFRFNPRAIGFHHAERSLDSWSNAHASYGRLEIQIFGRLGQAELTDVLAGNLSRLHVATRLSLRACLGRTELHDATSPCSSSMASVARGDTRAGGFPEGVQYSSEFALLARVGRSARPCPIRRGSSNRRRKAPRSRALSRAVGPSRCSVTAERSRKI